MKNNYGNYVVQKALKLSQGNFKGRLVSSILKNIEKIGDRKLVLKWKSIVYSHINSNDNSNSNSYSEGGVCNDKYNNNLNHTWNNNEMNMMNNSMYSNNGDNTMPFHNSGQNFNCPNFHLSGSDYSDGIGGYFQQNGQNNSMTMPMSMPMGMHMNMNNNNRSYTNNSYENMNSDGSYNHHQKLNAKGFKKNSQGNYHKGINPGHVSNPFLTQKPQGKKVKSAKTSYNNSTSISNSAMNFNNPNISNEFTLNPYYPSYNFNVNPMLNQQGMILPNMNMNMNLSLNSGPSCINNQNFYFKDFSKGRNNNN
jgi:hypothetical protein